MEKFTEYRIQAKWPRGTWASPYYQIEKTYRSYKEAQDDLEKRQKFFLVHVRKDLRPTEYRIESREVQRTEWKIEGEEK